MDINSKTLSRAVTAALVLGAIWLLQANHDSKSSSSSAACNVCREILIGSFSCAVQAGDVLAQVNFQGSGTLTPSPTGAGLVVLGGAPGGSVSLCESLADDVAEKLDNAPCEFADVMSPVPDQFVFDFACRGDRSRLVRTMGDISKKVITLSQ